MSTSVLDFHHTMTRPLTLFGRYISTSLKSDTQTNKKTQTLLWKLFCLWVGYSTYTIKSKDLSFFVIAVQSWACEHDSHLKIQRFRQRNNTKLIRMLIQREGNTGTLSIFLRDGTPGKTCAQGNIQLIARSRRGHGQISQGWFHSQGRSTI